VEVALADGAEVVDGEDFSLDVAVSVFEKFPAAKAEEGPGLW
jgi:hypothetical protein